MADSITPVKVSPQSGQSTAVTGLVTAATAMASASAAMVTEVDTWYGPSWSGLQGTKWDRLSTQLNTIFQTLDTAIDLLVTNLTLFQTSENSGRTVYEDPAAAIDTDTEGDFFLEMIAELSDLYAEPVLAGRDMDFLLDIQTHARSLVYVLTGTIASGPLQRWEQLTGDDSGATLKLMYGADYSDGADRVIVAMIDTATVPNAADAVFTGGTSAGTLTIVAASWTNTCPGIPGRLYQKAPSGAPFQNAVVYAGEVGTTNNPAATSLTVVLKGGCVIRTDSAKTGSNVNPVKDVVVAADTTLTVTDFLVDATGAVNGKATAFAEVTETATGAYVSLYLIDGDGQTPALVIDNINDPADAGVPDLSNAAFDNYTRYKLIGLLSVHDDSGPGTLGFAPMVITGEGVRRHHYVIPRGLHDEIPTSDTGFVLSATSADFTVPGIPDFTDGTQITIGVSLQESHNADDDTIAVGYAGADIALLLAGAGAAAHPPKTIVTGEIVGSGTNGNQARKVTDGTGTGLLWVRYYDVNLAGPGTKVLASMTAIPIRVIRAEGKAV